MISRARRHTGGPQAEIQHLLTFGQPLSGRGLQGLQLRVIVGRAEVLDRA
jgi:hypothetical protein